MIFNHSLEEVANIGPFSGIIKIFLYLMSLLSLMLLSKGSEARFLT